MTHHAAIARALLEARRRGTSIFAQERFRNGKWEIELTFAVGEAPNRTIRASETGAHAVAVLTSPFRWVRILEQRSVLTRISDPDDWRVIDLALTALGHQLLETLLDHLDPPGSADRGTMSRDLGAWLKWSGEVADCYERVRLRYWFRDIMTITTALMNEKEDARAEGLRWLEEGIRRGADAWHQV